MQRLQTEDVEALAEMLLEDVPRSILNLIARNPRISEGAIVGDLLQSLPSNVDQEGLLWHCRRSIRWFVDNGSIASAGNRRYVIMPTYAVRKQSSELVRIQLYGDGRQDQQLRQALASDDIRMQIQPVLERKAGVGFTRDIKVSVSRLSPVEKILTSFDVPIVSPQTLQKRLRTLDHVRFPPRSSFDVIPPFFGIWDQYHASHKEQSRWVAFETTENLNNVGFFRWRRDDEWYGDQNARYFLGIGESLLSELDEDQASYWMLYQDKMSGRLRRYWMDRDRLWVPRMLPSAYRQWFRLLSDETNYSELYLEYRISSALQEIAAVFEENLGLRLVHSEPGV